MPYKYRILLIALSAVLLLCGCKRNYTQAEATASINSTANKTPENWAARATDTGSVQDGWINNFNDPGLYKLVNEALGNSPNLQAAAAKVDRANALAKQAGAALAPTVSLGGQLAGRTAESPAVRGGGLAISWEADLWGRIGLSEKAAQDSAKAVAADYEFARQSLAAATARGWFLLCETNLQIDFLNDVVSIIGEMHKIEKTKEKVGKVSQMEVMQVHAQLVQAREAVAKAEIARQEAARSLETLIGRYPADQISGADTLVAVPPAIPAGQPSSILERRPDLIAAEDRVAAAFYAEKGTKLLHLPRFTIQAGAGISSLGEAIAGLAAGIFAPLYTGGKIEAEIQQATAEQKEAIADYASVALQAFKEVEVALSNERLLKAREELLSQVVSDNLKAYELSKVQFKVGKIDMFELLSHQSRWIGSQVSLLNCSRERLDNRVRLHLALGGDFEKAE